jgi:hypothetical protein
MSLMRMERISNIFVGDHPDKIQIEWLSASQLVIYSDCVVVRHGTNYHGVTIEKKDSK